MQEQLRTWQVWRLLLMIIAIIDKELKNMVYKIKIYILLIIRIIRDLIILRFFGISR